MKRIVRNQQGFTLIEIIAVLILLGILAAVAVPKYMDLTDTAREKAADGQIAEVKGRLNSALAKYMLENSGDKPGTATVLLDYANSAVTGDACKKTTAAEEGDFWFYCTDAGSNATLIHVTKVQNVTLGTARTARYDFDN